MELTQKASKCQMVWPTRRLVDEWTLRTLSFQCRRSVSTTTEHTLLLRHLIPQLLDLGYSTADRSLFEAAVAKLFGAVVQVSNAMLEICRSLGNLFVQTVTWVGIDCCYEQRRSCNKWQAELDHFETSDSRNEYRAGLRTKDWYGAISSSWGGVGTSLCSTILDSAMPLTRLGSGEHAYQIVSN